ncbi:MAG: CoA transferase [Spirochaetaceae bacterium]|nr:MAG: CoA transferase [Spirochaetaceae bacterium]
MSKPLAGVRVLDLSRVLAGPFCTMILGDLGAEVLKVEIPGKGDDSRSFGPFKNDRSLYFISINRGKRSVSLNLKTEKGRSILKKLMATHDVLVENYRPGVMEKLGLGYDTLRAEFPRLIYAASSGYGHTGPDSTRPAYDILAQAAGGLMSITGWPDGPPTRVGCSIGDLSASLYTAIGIMAALYQRTQTGKGQKVDVAMLDCQVSLLENALARYQVDGRNPERLGTRHPTIAPFQAYATKDDYMVVAIGNDALWKTLCNVIRRPDLIDDQRFRTNGDRTQNIDAMNQILEAEFRCRTTAEWEHILADAGLPHSTINGIDAVLKHPQVLARNMIVDVSDKVVGTVKIAGNPIKMSSFDDEVSRPPMPAVGQHNAEVYGDLLGYSESEIEALREEGVI